VNTLFDPLTSSVACTDRVVIPRIVILRGWTWTHDQGGAGTGGLLGTADGDTIDPTGNDLRHRFPPMTTIVSTGRATERRRKRDRRMADR